MRQILIIVSVSLISFILFSSNSISASNSVAKEKEKKVILQPCPKEEVEAGEKALKEKEKNPNAPEPDCPVTMSEEEFQKCHSMQGPIFSGEDDKCFAKYRRLEMCCYMPILLRNLKHENPEIRGISVGQLSITRDPKVIPYVIEVFEKDKDATVRINAVTGLGRLPAKQTIDALKKAAKDKNIYIRFDAIVALIKCGESKDYFKKLVDFAKGQNIDVNFPSSGADDLSVEEIKRNLRADALLNLYYIGTPAAVEAIEELTNDKDEEVRKDAQWKLKLLKKKEKK